MKFEAAYYPTIQSGAVIRWGGGYNRGSYVSIGGEKKTDFSAEVNCSRDGVSLNGYWPIMSAEQDVEDLIATLRKAWKAHQSIKGARGHGLDHDTAKAIVEAERTAAAVKEMAQRVKAEDESDAA